MRSNISNLRELRFGLFLNIQRECSRKMTFGIRSNLDSIATNFTYNLASFRKKWLKMLNTKSEYSLFRCLCLQETPENSIESHAIKNIIIYLFASNKS